jgi:aspartyl-tRNA synthetase
MEIGDLSDIAAESQFQVIRGVIDSGGVVKGLAVPGCAGYNRRQIQELTDFAKERGSPGLMTLGLDGYPDSPLDELSQKDIISAVSRHLSLEEVVKMAFRLGAKRGDLMLMVAATPRVTDLVLSQLRHELGVRLNLADPDLLAFAFVLDFPLLEWNQDGERWDSAHHPFTAPREDDLALLEEAPERVMSKAYDMVCNGVELASGSIRIHKRHLQERIFLRLGYGSEQVQERFGHLLEALEYGAPPHGGIAPGIDRLIQLLADASSIREVIAFPKTQNAADPLFNAPSPVDVSQLRDLHIRLAE